MEPTKQHAATSGRGWIVTFAGTGINLALGVLYTWSMFKGAIEKDFGWKGSQLNDPYALCCLVFAFSMILAGRCQDKFGPRLTASIGGLLVGAGLLLISTTNSYGLWLLGFGVLAGVGIGFGYSSATPPALKWFPPSKTGLIAGLVVAGFGLAPVYLAPTSQYLLNHFGLQKSMLIFGVAFVAIVCGLAQLLVNPTPPGYAAGPAGAGCGAQTRRRPHAAGPDAAPTDVLAALGDLLHWSGRGPDGDWEHQRHGQEEHGRVGLCGCGRDGHRQCCGRILAGMLSDKIGRRRTLMIVLLLQAVLMFVSIPVTGHRDLPAVVIVLVAALIGANYGANLSLFPSYTKDLWGLKTFGMNYGIVFTAWGVGGLVLPRLQQTLTAKSGGSYTSSFIVAAVLLIVGGSLTRLIKPQAQPRPVS